MQANYPSAVLWDMDGTLIDSEHYWLEAEQQLATANGSEWNPSDGLDLVGLSLYESARIMKNRMNLTDYAVEEIIDALTDSVVSQLRNGITWRPGAKELLIELRAAGIKTALVTMSMKRMAQEVAENLGFNGFDLVLGGDEVTFGKPHPEPYEKAAKLLGVETASCIALEDSLNGLTSAEAAGTVAIAVPNLIQIPAAPNREIWHTLEGKNLAALLEVFERRKA